MQELYTAIFLTSILVLYVCLTYKTVDCVICKYFKKLKRSKKMPMKVGKGKKVISQNIKEGMDSYKAKGTFGNSKPKSAKAAQKQIIAAAYSKAGKSKTKKK